MPALRYCRSCAGPRPRAARRCPWCLRLYGTDRRPPEHLFATYDRARPVPAPSATEQDSP
jgi:hypothetical protein